MYRLRCLHHPHTVQGPNWSANLWSKQEPSIQQLAQVVEALSSHTYRELNKPAATSALNEALRPLGFDFALILNQHQQSEINLLVGPRSTFPLYWQAEEDSGALTITDHLPHTECSTQALRDQLDANWLKTFLAHCIASGPMEFSPSPRTIYKAWQRVPASHCVQLDTGSASRPSRQTPKLRPFDNISNPHCLSYSRLDELQEFIRAALIAHLQQVRCVPTSSAEVNGNLAVELSGGIDSGLVMAAAFYARTQAIGMAQTSPLPIGICNRYPYPEFRREAVYQQAIQRQYNIELNYLEGAQLLPFAGLSSLPVHDEPSVLTTSWGHLITMHQHCHDRGIQTLLTGHGGDTLFEVPPSAPILTHSRGDLPALFSQSCQAEVRERGHEIRDFLNQQSAPWQLSKYWHPTLLDSPFINRVFMHDSTHPLTYTSGLICPDVVTGLHAYWQLSHRTPRSPVRATQKPVAYELFKDLLPEAVWRRPGKVNHLGLAYRGLFNSRRDLSILTSYLELFAPLLEFNVGAMQETLHTATSGLQSGASWVSRMIALLAWAHAREHGQTLVAE